ncbi:MAG TPA: transcriptional regulator, partial [Thermoanaerobaculia bacterium]
GLDLIPVLFEITLWSAKYDSKSEARRIARLVDLIRSDNRRISQRIIEKVRRGEAVLPEYLDR